MPRGGRRKGSGRKKDPNSQRSQMVAAKAEPRASANRPLDMRALISLSNEAVEAARAKANRRDFNPFKLPDFPPQALPPKDQRMAMDSSLEWASSNWAGVAGALLNTMGSEGLLFPGYTYLSELAQRPEYRIISETIADDCTRKWITFDITGTEKEIEDRQAEDEDDPEGAEERRVERVNDAGKTDRVRELMKFLDKLEARDHFYSLIRGDGMFGRMHLFMSFGQQDETNTDELRTPVGDGSADISKTKVSQQNPLRRLKAIEPVWTYPMAYNAVNPLLEDWYNPQYWYVMGRELHVSRILPFISRPVPDILKPSYAFGGIALSQLAEPYVNIWLRTRQSVADLIHSFSVMVLKTNLQTMTQPDAASNLLGRMALFNALRDNNGSFVIDKQTEEFANVSASLSGLHELQAQSQEHMSFPARIPLVKLTGIQPSGLNASSEGEIRVYYDTINSYQNRTVRRPLQIVVNFAMLSLWGEIDEDLMLEFEPLWEMSKKEQAELQKMEAERDGAFIDKGVLAPEEVRERVISDPDLPYGGLDPEDVPDLAQEEEEGLQPGGKKPGGGEGGGGGDDEGAADAAILPFFPAGADEAWSESKHPRAPDGKFGSGSGSETGGALKQSDLKKVGNQMGSNPGGVFEDKSGTRFYVKAGKSTDHVANELLAADLFRLAGGKTLEYRPVEGGNHIATKLAKLDKANARDLTPAERKAAQQDFVANAWLANWDSIGTGGDNIGVVGGKPTALDFGGALAYRAQGAPKGKAFADTVGELQTMRDKGMSPDAAKFYAGMTDEDLARSAERVTSITNEQIRDAVKKHGGGPELGKKLIARKQDIATRFGLATDEAPFEEGKHPRAPDGKFTDGAGGGSSKSDDDEPKAGGYGGLWQASPQNTPISNWAHNVGVYINQKPQIGIHYRRMMAKMLKDADKFQASPELKEKIKEKLVDSLWGSLASAKKKGKADEVVKIAKTLEKLTGKALNEKYLESVTKPESKSTPVAAVPQATPEELKLAQKTTTLMMPPAMNSPEGAKLLTEFNKKYGQGTTPLTDPAALNQKVADFKKLKADIQTAYNEYQAEQQEKAKTAQAKAAAEKAAKMADPDYAALSAAAHGYEEQLIKSGEYVAKVAAQHGAKLTPTQGGLIKAYIGNSYEKLNQQLYEGVMEPGQYEYRKQLEVALSQMPVYEGEVTRGLQGINATIFAKYKPGHVVPSPAFMSAGKKEKLWGSFTLKIKGKTARDISMLNGEGGGEVVFLPHTHFKVVSNDGNTAVLEELH